jgi:single-strand DNA-binding protein
MLIIMEMFTGRVTANAKVTKLKDERQVVNFTVAVNDYYKSKNSSEGKQVVTFFNCAYWISPKAAERLTKGALVSVIGRLYVTAFNCSDGEARASLHCHVNSFRVLGSSKAMQKENIAEKTTGDNLPF